MLSVFNLFNFFRACIPLQIFIAYLPLPVIGLGVKVIVVQMDESLLSWAYILLGKTDYK